VYSLFNFTPLNYWEFRAEYRAEMEIWPKSPLYLAGRPFPLKNNFATTHRPKDQQIIYHKRKAFQTLSPLAGTIPFKTKDNGCTLI